MVKSDRSPQCIVISGIDGSGKTTLINLLLEDLKSKGVRTSYIWLRFNHYFTKILHALARLLGLSVRADTEMGRTWHHHFYKSKLFCRFYILATYVDTVLSRFKYRSVARGSDVVICDRWVVDILVDLAVKTHQPEIMDSKIAEKFLKLLPNGALLFIVFRETEKLLACRIENKLDPDFVQRQDIYKKLLDKSFIHPIDNNGSLKESLSQIYSVFINRGYNYPVSRSEGVLSF